MLGLWATMANGSLEKLLGMLDCKGYKIRISQLNSKQCECVCELGSVNKNFQNKEILICIQNILLKLYFKNLLMI